MPTNFEPKRLKPKLDNAEKRENRVHRLTESNGAPHSVYSGYSEQQRTFLSIIALNNILSHRPKLM